MTVRELIDDLLRLQDNGKGDLQVVTTKMKHGDYLQVAVTGVRVDDSEYGPNYDGVGPDGLAVFVETE